jgi:hypothetical protein
MGVQYACIAKHTYCVLLLVCTYNAIITKPTVYRNHSLFSAPHSMYVMYNANYNLPNGQQMHSDHTGNGTTPGQYPSNQHCTLHA